MPYTDSVMWALDHVDPKERIFCDIRIFRDIHNVVIASFRPDIFARETPKQLPHQNLSRKFMPI